MIDWPITNSSRSGNDDDDQNCIESSERGFRAEELEYIEEKKLL